MSMFFVERVARLSPPLRDLVFPFALAICPELLNVDSPDLRPRPVHVSTAPLWKVSSLQPPTCGRPPLQPPPCGRPALKTTHVETTSPYNHPRGDGRPRPSGRSAARCLLFHDAHVGTAVQRNCQPPAQHRLFTNNAGLPDPRGDGRPRPSRRAKLAVFSFTMPMSGRLSNETASLRCNIDFSQIMPACLTHVGTAALGRPGGAQLAVFSATMLTWGRPPSAVQAERSSAA